MSIFVIKEEKEKKQRTFGEDGDKYNFISLRLNLTEFPHKCSYLLLRWCT